ncbi:hypothetical protein [Acidocella sp.]|uniref:hypothetical protein n=1 Tax=Acidocella sp. TaxID=50710 RepID=UPI0026135926|nr:hypothetical protein [Acidocella sp.]
MTDNSQTQTTAEGHAMGYLGGLHSAMLEMITMTMVTVATATGKEPAEFARSLRKLMAISEAQGGPPGHVEGRSAAFGIVAQALDGHSLASLRQMQATRGLRVVDGGKDDATE